MKFNKEIYAQGTAGRSREGAWIEISALATVRKESSVAPARERGLKLRNSTSIGLYLLRSREGAWIEIISLAMQDDLVNSRSREGAWIEIQIANNQFMRDVVAPARERGLKFPHLQRYERNRQSLPRGSVD